MRLLCLALLLLTAAAGEEFDVRSFRRPPADFYPSVFWNWNDRMDAARIREQVEDNYVHKLLTLCILPMPRDFRPDSTGNRLDVDYLSDEYFSRYRLALDEANKRGMKAWLYDEGGWPSGSATGRVVKSDRELRGSNADRGAAPAGARGKGRHASRGDCGVRGERKHAGGLPHPPSNPSNRTASIRRPHAGLSN